MELDYEQYLNELRKNRAAVFYFAGLESLDYENVASLENWLKRELIMAVKTMMADPRQAPQKQRLAMGNNVKPVVHVVAYGGVKGIGRIYETVHRLKIDYPQIGEMLQTVAIGSEHRLSYLEATGQLAPTDYMVNIADSENTGHAFVTNKLLQAALPNYESKKNQYNQQNQEGTENQFSFKRKLHVSSDLLCRAAPLFSWGFFAGGGKTVSMQVNQLQEVQSIATKDALIRASIAHAKGILEPNKTNLLVRMQKEGKDCVIHDLSALEEFLEGSGLTQLVKRADEHEKRNTNYQMLQNLKRGDNLAGIFLREERSALMNRFIRAKDSIIPPANKKQYRNNHQEIVSTLPIPSQSLTWG